MQRLVVDYIDKSYTYNDRLLLKDINLSVPDNGLYGFVSHDWQQAKFDFKPRQLAPDYKDDNVAVPSTRMMWGRYNERIYDFVTFPPVWQKWLLELLRVAIGEDIPYGEIEYYYDRVRVNMGNGVIVTKEKIVAPHPYAYVKVTEGSLLWAYVNLIENHRSFSDTQAPENGYYDSITGRNIGKKPYSWKCLTTTGNIVKILGSWREYYIIEAFDLLKNPPLLEDVINKNWLIQWATEQTVNELPKLDDKRRWVVSRYPQVRKTCEFNGISQNGTPFPLCSMGGTNLIKKADVIIMQNGQRYSPYMPEK